MKEGWKLARSTYYNGVFNYQHTCNKEDFEHIVTLIEKHPTEGWNIPRLFRATGIQACSIGVAVGLLRDRGLVEREGQVYYPSEDDLWNDSMIEWDYLYYLMTGK
tara:strand:- start:10287 stop:10601 length:315 start_codon:yes stop_codon:yes gene_type:complete